jgi:hypothetical protein
MMMMMMMMMARRRRVVGVGCAGIGRVRGSRWHERRRAFPILWRQH